MTRLLICIVVAVAKRVRVHTILELMGDPLLPFGQRVTMQIADSSISECRLPLDPVFPVHTPSIFAPYLTLERGRANRVSCQRICLLRLPLGLSLQ